MTPQPIEVREFSYEDCPDHYLDAFEEATSCSSHASRFRVETFHAEDIRRVFTDVFQWDMDYELCDEADRKRIREIIDLLESGEPQFPYVSIWADSVEEWMTTTVEDDYISVPNHGDGWHRVIAFLTLELPTIEILFPSP